MRKLPLVMILIILTGIEGHAQDATIREEMVSMKTYMFSEPNPIPEISRIYPYFRFDGYTNQAEAKEWKMVILENDYIKVFVCPDIGGKVWGAIEKSTGKEFLYYNHTVKFRDVAMRGAWTSGGLEFNFGDIGHIPTCATPVDYILKENQDGSVSCVVGALDLPSRTSWNVEIKLEKDKAYFETKASWFNDTPVPVTYYHWMNAAAKASGNLEFIYPGSARIGHGGELGNWPVDNGREISFYEKNNFGVYKSYHVLNAYADFFGGYWHDEDFGFGHFSSYDDKPGKKIWIWGLSDQGMIWEDLLTDTDGQYVEYQAGKLFNQAAHSSTFTPFKHREFSPYDSDIMRELWFPLKETKGMDAASEFGVFNVGRKGKQIEILFSALQEIKDELVLFSDGKQIASWPVNLRPLEKITHSIELDATEDFELILGESLLYYNSNPNTSLADRPLDPDPKFDWEALYGLYIQALELEKQRRYEDAHQMYLKALQKDPSFLPALSRIALSYYRRLNYDSAFSYVNRALSIDTYDPLGNYLYGLVSMKEENWAQAKSGFSIASHSVSYRSAAYTELARIFLREKRLNTAQSYIDKALAFNAHNSSSLEILAVIARIQGNQKKAEEVLNKLETLNAVNPFLVFEQIKWAKLDQSTITKIISNELAFDTFLELALKYEKLARREEAIEVLKLSPNHPLVDLWMAYLTKSYTDSDLLNKMLDKSTEMVFPHRIETATMLDELIAKNSHWKLKYFQGLIYWNRGLSKSAKELFTACGDEPQNSSFYLARAKLFSEDRDQVQASLERALELGKDDWRVNQLWIDQLLKQGKYTSARDLADKFSKLHPEKSVFGISYAKSLMALENYEECISFLEDFIILPYEGSTEGRIIYHEACLKEASKSLQEGNFKRAVLYGEKAKLWPINLGVGKHYDVDERLDDFIIAFAYENQGSQTKADEYYQKVIKHQTPPYLNENSKLYLQAIAMEKYKQKRNADELIQSSIEKEPDNKYLQWVKAMFSGSDGDLLAVRLLDSAPPVQAYDTQFRDKEFYMLRSFVDSFIKK